MSTATAPRASIWSRAFGFLQKIGKSLMLPVSVLPVAGLLLGIGSAHFTWLPPLVSDVMAQSGGAIFGNLALIFAIGVALGVTQNDGVAALAAVVGYAVLLATMGVMAAVFGYKPTAIMGIQSIETGVFGGIVVGLIEAPAAGDRFTGCTEDVSKALIRRILRRPKRFYVNVHTTPFPGGAVQGTLRKPPKH